jgi:hypothetical protein
VLFIAGDQILPVPFLMRIYDLRKFISLELLVFWRMGIIEGPLL